MSDMMTFPNTIEEFMKQYKIVDTEKIYTNGAELIPIFRMMQWLEHVSVTDCISRQAALDIFDDYNVAVENGQIEAYSRDRKRLCDLPSVQAERPNGKWLSHYDYCKKHGYIPSEVIALWWCDQCEQGVEYPTNFCPNCGADMKGGQDG